MKNGFKIYEENILLTSFKNHIELPAMNVQEGNILTYRLNWNKSLESDLGRANRPRYFAGEIEEKSTEP